MGTRSVLRLVFLPLVHVWYDYLPRVMFQIPPTHHGCNDTERTSNFAALEHAITNSTCLTPGVLCTSATKQALILASFSS